MATNAIDGYHQLTLQMPGVYLLNIIIASTSEAPLLLQTLWQRH